MKKYNKKVVEGDILTQLRKFKRAAKRGSLIRVKVAIVCFSLDILDNLHIFRVEKQILEKLV